MKETLEMTQNSLKNPEWCHTYMTPFSLLRNAITPGIIPVSIAL